MTDDAPLDYDAELADAAAPTELAGLAQADTGSAYAWALADDDGLDARRPRLTPGQITTAAVTASIVAIAAAVGIGYRLLRSDPEAPITASAATPLSSITVTARAPAPPPPVATVTTIVIQQPAQTVTQLAPTGHIQPPSTTDFDQLFLNRLRASGYAITNATPVLHDAHLICAQLAHGGSVSQAIDDYAAASYDNWSLANLFVSTVMSTYPNC